MAKFRKKPVVVEAIQYGPYTMPTVELLEFMSVSEVKVIRDGLVIETLEGQMTASPGDWIIKGVNGEFYPCKPDIFEKTYDPEPQTPDPQSSEGESTEAADDSGPFAPHFQAVFDQADENGFLPKDYVDPPLSNGTTHPEQQD